MITSCSMLMAAVVVPGIRPSLGKSLEAQRESHSVIDVLAVAENLAEALQRFSGVSISREFGEGERVSRSFNYLMLPI